MHVSTNWLFVIFAVAAGIVLYIAVRYVKNEKMVTATVLIFLLGLLGYGIFSDKSYTDRVTVAEAHLQKYGADMKSMGVKRISYHVNPAIGPTYSILVARKNGKYYNETCLSDWPSPTPYPTPMSSWGYYIGSLMDLAMQIIAPSLAFDNKAIAEIKVVDGKVVVKANRGLIKKVGPEAVSLMVEAITEYHLKRLAKAEGVPYRM